MCIENSPPQPTAPYASASIPCGRQLPSSRPQPYTPRCYRWETPRRNPVSPHTKLLPTGGHSSGNHGKRTSPHALRRGSTPSSLQHHTLIHTQPRAATRRPPLVRRAQAALPRWRGRSRTFGVPSLSSLAPPTSLTGTGGTSGGLRSSLSCWPPARRPAALAELAIVLTARVVCREPPLALASGAQIWATDWFLCQKKGSDALVDPHFALFRIFDS